MRFQLNGTATDLDGFELIGGKIEGTVFSDVNGNGSQDPDEPGIEGVDVVITDSENMTITLTTDENGEYSEVVAAGTAVTDIDDSTLPAGAIRSAGTDPTTVEVPVGGTGTDVDGFQLPVGKIEGTVFWDVNGNGAQDAEEPGIDGVDVVITDSNGKTFTVTTDDEWKLCG